ncbi:MAG TPA: gamma-glutamyl-gamma-aminobutyrate hydrolase family protein [Fibrobacteria bacterium]|nr:gamma-glutamyl-gamma-aminobutyrate hydrolase family protein [Fibrobacteria bacterium]
MNGTRLIAISMRRTSEKEYVEERDALARDWWAFLKTALPGWAPLLLPNDPGFATALCSLPEVGGLLLTGGNDVGSCEERDATEEASVRTAKARSLPILGVCRGMQFLAHLHGARLTPCERGLHVAKRHRIRFAAGHQPLREVNSFHGIAVSLPLESPLVPEAYSEDGTLEAFRVPDKPIRGIMWHPEREKTPAAEDIELFRTFFADSD